MSRQKNKEARKSFLALFNEGNYPQAFIIATKYPFLKKTKVYSELQQHFHALLKIAALYIKQGNILKAKEILGVYARVEEKRLVVKLLLEYGELFLEFLSAVSMKDLQKVYKTVKQYPRFGDVPSFVEYDVTIEERLQKIDGLIESMELERVDVDFLTQLLPFKKQALFLSQKLQKTRRLQKLYEEELFWQCYDYIAENEEIQNTQLAQLLQNHYQKQLKKAKEVAKKGDIAQLVELFEPFIQSRSKHQEIESVFADASAVKIEQLLQHEDYLLAQKALFLAVERFGKKEVFLELEKSFFQKTGVRLLL